MGNRSSKRNNNTRRTHTKRKFDIVTFGSAVLDSLVISRFIEKKGGLFIPYGSKMLIDDLSFQIGGGGTNTAVAFARFGFKTGYIGRVGDDLTGNEVIKLLRAEKVAFLGEQVKNTTSGFSVVLMSRDRHRSILTHKGINNDIGPRGIKPFSSAWLYLSSLLEKSFKTQLQLATKLKKQGVKIAYNPSEYQIRCMNVKPLLKLCDVVVLNREEAKLLAGKKEPLAYIHSLGPKIVVITNDRNLVYCFDGANTYSLRPPKVSIVDKTGAGDAFASGFVAGLMKEKSLQECLKLGIREATSVVKYPGAKNKLLKSRL